MSEPWTATINRQTAANCDHEWSPWWDGKAAEIGEWRVCRQCTKREIRSLFQRDKAKRAEQEEQG